MKNICVIGAGGTGQCFAADMALAGHNVFLFDDRSARLEEIRNAGGICLTGGGRTGKAEPVLCEKAADAIKHADLVVVCAVAHRHETLARLCAPFLTDGQTVFISAGSGSSLIFDRAIRDTRGLGKKDAHGVVLGELEGNLYPCRRLRPAQIFMAFPPAMRMVAAFPSCRTPVLQETLKGVLETDAATNVLETALNSPNVVIHLMGSLLNLGAIERSGGEYWLYKTGLTPGVLTMLEAMDREKTSVFDAWGWNARSPLPHMRRVARQDQFPELDAFRSLIGPTNITHRYISEDAATCVCLLADVGRLAGLDMPISSGLLALASALHSKSYASQGRTLEALGLGCMSMQEVTARLQDF